MGTGESPAPTYPRAGRVGRLTVFKLFKIFLRSIYQMGRPFNALCNSTYYVGKPFNVLLFLIIIVTESIQNFYVWESPSTRTIVLGHY